MKAGYSKVALAPVSVLYLTPSLASKSGVSMFGDTVGSVFPFGSLPFTKPL